MVYEFSEYGFRFAPSDKSWVLGLAGSEGMTSFNADTLMVVFGIESRRVLYVSGYFPMEGWDREELQFPLGSPGVVFVEADDPVPGVSIPVEADEWRARFDSKENVFCFGGIAGASTRYVEVATGVMLAIENRELVEVWLKPSFVS
ncbi:hypothetical protein [Actinoalloteichus hoggarensis]|nr:hypothetical protein [Actinoalloteichus hoggarensis]